MAAAMDGTSVWYRRWVRTKSTECAAAKAGCTNDPQLNSPVSTLVYARDVGG